MIEFWIDVQPAQIIVWLSMRFMTYYLFSELKPQIGYLFLQTRMYKLYKVSYLLM
jgi:hypothetical protein